MHAHAELLARYAADHSEAAFTELVRCHVDLVYSAALRLVGGDAHRAQDVTQQVFTELARQAQRLTRHPALSGWLYTTTRLMALRSNRTEQRRQAREREAHTMTELLQEPAAELNWEQFRPVLDSAMHELGEEDRLAVLLRYFQNKPLKEVGSVLGLNENAARMRVDRALDKLRVQLARKGLNSATTALALALTTHAVGAAPPAFVTSLASAALAGAATGTGTTLTLLNLTTMTKLQAGIISAIVVATVATSVVMQLEARAKVRGRDDALQQQRNELVRLQEETARMSNLLAQAANPDQIELLRLRGEVARLRTESQELARSKAANAAAPADAVVAAAKDWRARVNLLKQRLEATPGASIPELQLVTEEDWLSAARGKLETEADYRRALSELRRAGEGKVAKSLRKALSEYMRTHNDQLPNDLAQLQPFFDSPIDASILERWGIASAATIKSLGLGGDTVITQKAPVDDVFDARFGIGPNGYGTTDFLYQGIGPAMGPVWEAYRAAHGRLPEDPSELLSYVTTPEQQVAVQKLLLRRSAQH